MRYPIFNRRLLLIVIFCLLFSVNIFAQKLLEKNWHVTFQTGNFGPVEAVLKFKEIDGKLYAYNVSGSQKLIRKLPGVQTQKAQINEYLFAFTLEKSADTYAGAMIAPWANGKVSLKQNAKGFAGKISGGRFAGDFSGVAFDETKKPLRNYRTATASLIKNVESKVFDPRTLQTKDWKKLAQNMKKIGAAARDDLDLLLGFQFAYEGKPFSHLTLGRARIPADQLMIQFDSFRAGNDPVTLEFEKDYAVLNVKTMIGVDTIELIEKAFADIAEKSPKALIIDLRGNGGGAFAIKPLIEHIIDKPLDAGYFVTHQWNLKNKRLPNREELFAVKPWEGFSLKAWWENVQSERIIRLRFEPQEPNFNAPVFILMDKYSASATEMAIDALGTVENVKLIGQKTNGAVLSQSPFDIAEGFQAFIPVADYYSFHNGRLEGIGIKPDIETKPDQDALATAKELIELIGDS